MTMSFTPTFDAVITPIPEEEPPSPVDDAPPPDPPLPSPVDEAPPPCCLVYEQPGALSSLHVALALAVVFAAGMVIGSSWATPVYVE